LEGKENADSELVMLNQHFSLTDNR